MNGLAVRIPRLTYHRVGMPHDASDCTCCITPFLFAAHLRALAGAGHRPRASAGFAAWLEGGRSAPRGRPLVLTFDAGHAGLHAVGGQASSRALLGRISFGSNDGRIAAVARDYWSRLRATTH